MIVKLRLPEDAELHIKKGQKVKVGEPFYSVKRSEALTIDVAKGLGIKPSNIFQATKVVVGTSVKPGDTLAQTKKVLGTKKIATEHAGIVRKIDHESGILSLEISSSEDIHPLTFFKGTVQNIDTQSHIVEIEVGDGIAESVQEISTDMGGELTKLHAENFFAASDDDVDGHVILVKELQSHMQSKLEAMGAVGVVFVKGSETFDFPSAQIKLETFQKLESQSYTHIVFSSLDNKLFAYN